MSPTDPPWSETGRIPGAVPARAHPGSSSTRMRLPACRNKGAPDGCAAAWRRHSRSAASWQLRSGSCCGPRCVARADDGIAIAYSVIGAGPVTIVVVSPLISQLELGWEEPALEHFPEPVRG